MEINKQVSKEVKPKFKNAQKIFNDCFLFYLVFLVDREQAELQKKENNTVFWISKNKLLLNTVNTITIRVETASLLYFHICSGGYWVRRVSRLPRAPPF